MNTRNLKNDCLNRLVLACALAWSASVALADYSTTLSSLNPLCYWRLNEPTQPIVPTYPMTNIGTAGVALNGLYYGVPSLGQPGALTSESDTAAEFGAASKYVEVPYNLALNPPTSFTVEFWAKRTNSSTATASVLCNFGPGRSNGYLVFSGNADLKWTFRTYNGTTRGSLISAAPIVQDEWTHVVCVHDGTGDGANYIYLNGVLDSSLSPAPYAPQTVSNMRIGIGPNNESPAWYFPGLLDEVAIYPTALSDTQITAHYDAGTSANPTFSYKTLVQTDGAVAYWRLNEATLPPYVPYPATNSGALGSALNGDYSTLSSSSGVPGPTREQFAGFATDNKAVRLNETGAAGRVNFPAVTGMITDQATITCWVKRAGSQVDTAPMFFHEAASGSAALNFQYATPNLAYHWEDGSTVHWSWTSGLLVPDDVWTFVALVVTPENAVMYMGSTNGLTCRTNVSPHAVHDFSSAPGVLGAQLGRNDRYLKGWLDEVALLDQALDYDTVSNLFYSATPAVPLVTRAPADPLYEGMTVNFAAYGVASGPANYQWRKNGGNVGANSPTLTLSNVTTNDSGNYDVVVSFGANSVTSAVQSITIAQGPPVIFAQPVGGTRFEGGKIIFNVSAGGSVPLTYQWQKGSADIPGATSESYSLTGITTAGAGDYRVVVVNPYGTNISTVAPLAVLPVADYAAVVMAGQPDAYWRLDETSGTIAFDYAGGLNGTNNATVVNGVDGPRPPARPGFESGNVARHLNGTDAWITAAPLNWNTDKATFTAWVNLSGYDDDLSGVVFSRGGSASGIHILSTGELRYHWNGGQWGFASGIGVPLGTWTFLALVVEPSRATLYMNDGNGLVSATNNAGHGVAALSDPFFLGRDRTDRPLVGDIDEVAIYKRALSPAEIVNLSLMGITGPTPPAIVSQPAPQIVFAGQTATFAIGSIGAEPVTYQWKLNGADIAGATSKILTLTDVYYTDAGNYSVGITNAQGYANSLPAALTVVAPPTFVNLTNELVLHLKFEDDVLDSSGRGNDGTIVGATNYVPGKLGNALRYTTEVGAGIYNYVTLGTPADLQFGATTDFSVAYWVRFTGLPGDLPFLCSAPNSYGNVGLTFAPSYNLGGWSYWVGGDSGGAGLYGAANSINDGNWHSLVHSFSRTGNAVTYLDGAQVDSRPFAGVGNADSGLVFNVGQDPYGSYAEDGQADIDDLGIWRRALNNTEAQSIFLVGQQGKSFDSYGPVLLTIEKVGGEVELIWEAGTLESADNVGGPYTSVSGAVAPFHKVTVGTGNKFYRVKL